MMTLIVGGIVILALLAVAYLTFFTVEQQSNAVVERFGKFTRIAAPGLNMKIPLIDSVVYRLTMRIQQLDVTIETKTEDNVFVNIRVSVQYHVMKEKIYEAYYKLEDPRQQITSFVFDVVRARVPKMKLDHVFEKKDDIADAVKKELEEIMSQFGYGIVKTLVTEIDPDETVKQSMNEINAATRQRVAANERGEAEKILKVKTAEAEAASSKLRGQGMADQRKAIIDGLRESVANFQKAVQGTDTTDVLNLVLITQYFDTIKDLSANSNTNTILVPHSPGAVNDLAGQIRESLIVANQVPTTKKGDSE